MVKFGICRVEDFALQPDGVVGKLRALLTRNRISYQLLRTPVPPGPGDIARFEAIMHNMQLTSGVYRTTRRNRFNELDQFLNGLLAERFPGNSAEFEVEDWAASDCLTSFEWAKSLLPRFPGARLTASDLMLSLVEIESADGTSFILEGNGEPLQYVSPPFVIRLGPPEPKWLPVNHWLGQRASAKLQRFRDQAAIPRDWLESDAGTLEIPPYRLRKIKTVHPDAQALAAREPRFRLRDHSVFEPAAEPVDVIRSMNIFNRIYFPEERLAQGARAVWQSLKPGGWWIVGRTWRDDPPEHNATVLLRTAAGFEVFRQYNEGSEMTGIALALNYETNPIPSSR